MNTLTTPAIVADLEARAERLTTPCGAGHLVWHAWGSGPTLVLAHGGFGSWMHWVRNIDALAEGFRVLAVDLPGLGQSDLPPEPVSPASLGDIVATGIEALAAPELPVHVVGFSFGGLVSGQAVARLGERITTFTLVGASGLALRRPHLELRRREPDMTPEAVAVAQRFNLLALMLRHERNLDDAALYIHARNDEMARLRSRRHSLGASLREALPDIRARLQGIWGEFDATSMAYVTEREALLKSHQPGARFHVVPDAGHWVQYEGAEDFNATLLKWLQAC